MARKTNESLKISCLALQRIVSIKKLNERQIKAIYTKLKSSIIGYKRNESVQTYFISLISHIVDDFAAITDACSKVTPELKSAAIEELYQEIVNYYPVFNIDIVLMGSNGVKPADPLNTLLSEEDFKVAKQKQKQKEGEKVQPGFKNLEDIENFRKELKHKLIGQDEAVDTMINYMKLIVAGLEKRASFLFIGPTGVGKTYLARLFGEKYSGNFYKVDCGGLSSGHEFHKLLGSPPGYVGHAEKSLLAEKAEKSNRWVFLFDEIEKAHEKFYNFLLSMLDDGTVQDNNGKTLDFTESIFIFTSNKGVSDLKHDYLGFGKKRDPITSETKEILEKSIKTHFSPEFRNRIDEYMYFNTLTREDAKAIIKLQLDQYTIEKTPQLINWIAENAFSIEYGAREINRFIKRNIGLEIANALFANKTPINSTYFTPSIVDNKLTIIDAIESKSTSGSK